MGEIKARNILLVCTSLNMGGAENQAVWLANKLDTEGYKVHFISLKQKGVLNDDLNENINVRNFKIASSKNKITKVINALSSIKQIVEIMKTNKVETAISFLFHANLFTKLSLAFIGRDIKHIVAVRNDRLSKRSSRVSNIRNFIFKNFIISSETPIVFNSEAGRKNFNLEKKYKQFVIYNTPLNNPHIFDKQSDKFVYVGRLDELKNTPALVDAVKDLRDSGIQIVIDIYGTGPDLQVLKSKVKSYKIENQITFKGLDKNIRNNLSEYKALILPSTHEGMPNVIIEAMNSKIICIATDTGDTKNLIKQNRGILIDGYNSTNIASAINSYLRLSKQEKTDIQNNAYQFVQNTLDEKTIFKKWENLIS